MFREYVPDKPGIFLPPIEIQEHPQKGYICVAAQDIMMGTLIERCATMKIASGMMQALFKWNEGRTILHDYVFQQSMEGFAYWAMGYGGIYSHSENPNAYWKIKFGQERDTVEIRALRDIAKGEEITYRYVHKGFEEHLWFEPVD